jgi:uncharacterized membrane protein YjdF
MTAPSTGIWLAIVAVTIVVANSVASLLHWYYFVWWFDMPMHFLGGFFTALIGMTLGFRFFRATYQVNPNKAILLIVLLVVIIGVGWELYELVVQNISGTRLVTALDSVSDVFFDLAGGLTALIIFVRENVVVYNR